MSLPCCITLAFIPDLYFVSLIRTIGAASTVLLKNERNALPLKGPKSIAVIGSGAGANSDGPNACSDRSCNKGVLAMGWGSGTANFPYLITVSLLKRNSSDDAKTSLLQPLDALTNRSALDGTNITLSLSDDDTKAAANAAVGKDVAFVFITADSGEDGYIVEWNAGDRNDLNAWHNGVRTKPPDVIDHDCEADPILLGVG